MTRQQKRKMERNSKKKQTSMNDVLSISMVDTKSIFENKCQFISTGEEAIKNYLKKNQRLMETNVLVNFGFDTQINFGIISIIHDCLKDLDVENLIKSTVDFISDKCSELNFESILQETTKIVIITHNTKDLKFDSSKSITENIENKALQNGRYLITINKELELEAA
jgi:ATP-dependent protease HslVU (ClpYQ) peptidase subunit